MRIKLDYVRLCRPNIVYSQLEGVCASEGEVWGNPEGSESSGEIYEFRCDGYEGRSQGGDKVRVVEAKLGQSLG
jgi:hypothetical protein